MTIPVVVNEHSRRFPRTLQDAFRISEGYRHSIELPTAEERRERFVYLLIETVCWGVSIGFLVFCAWWSWTTKKTPW
jgi:hypothetical protein